MAAVACLSSLLLLWFLLDSWNYASVFQTFGLGGVSYGQVTTAIYLKVSVSDFLTLFSARTGGDFFWTTAPSPVLLVAGGVALGTTLSFLSHSKHLFYVCICQFFIMLKLVWDYVNVKCMLSSSSYCSSSSIILLSLPHDSPLFPSYPPS